MDILARLKLYIIFLLVLTVCTLNLNIANLTLLAMVKDHQGIDGQINVEETCSVQKNTSNSPNEYGGSLEWSGNVQYFFLTSPYFSYIISQTFGGIVTHKFGSRLIVTCSLLTISLCNIFLSFLCKFHYAIGITLQVLQGFGQGMVIPALYGMISRWIPVQETCRFMSCFQGVSIGSVLSQIVSGLIITYARWEYVFIISGLIGLVLTTGWRGFAYDTPELCPEITECELTYIQENRTKADGANGDIPWLSMICSLPLWSIVISTFGRMWMSAILSIYGPLYLKSIVGLDAQMNGLFSGAVYLGNFALTLIVSFISDKVLTVGVMSLLASRKLITAIGQICPAILMFALGYLGCNVPLILSVWALMHLFLSVCFAGAMVNIVDIAPAFSSTAMNLVQIVGMTPDVLATLVAKSYLENGISLNAWRKVFIASALIGMASYTFYFFFASAETQKWNYVDKEKVTRDEEEKIPVIK